LKSARPARPRRLAGALLAAIGVCLLWPIAAIAQSPWGRDYWPNVSLTTQDDKQVKFYDDVLHGKIVVVNFIFTNCGDVCPLDTAQLKRVQELIGDHAGRDVFMYSISVDPKNDTPKAMREFMKRYDISGGWTFLTGKAEDIDLIQRKFGLEPAGDKPTAHSTTIILANESTGQFIKRSPYDNPQMLANLLTRQLNPNATGPGAGSRQSYANAVSVPAGDEGAHLFRTRCSSCHAIGGGDGLGPDLLMVSSRRSPEWITRFIKEPDKMLAEKDPIATPQMARFRNLAMPNLKLSQKDIADVMAFLDSESKSVMEERAAAEHAQHGAGHH
jgi:protein SCO1/2